MHIVTGMHRSGTSFLSQALNALGADFGPAEGLFASDFWNQNGYFESIDVVDINNRMVLGDKAKIDYWLSAPESGLARLRNSVASRKLKYLFCPGIAGITTRGQAYQPEIAALHHRYEGQFVKDPRFCLTLTPWLDGGPVETLVFTFRSPDSVARSIKRRERLPLWLGYQQWMYHMRGFFSQVSPETSVLIVDFDRFFDGQHQEEAFSRLIRFMNADASGPAYDLLRQTLEPRLRNHALPPETASSAVQATYHAARDLYEACATGPIQLKDHALLHQKILGQ